MPEDFQFVPSIIDPFEDHLLIRVQMTRTEDALTMPFDKLKGQALSAVDLPLKPAVGLERNGTAVKDWVCTTRRAVEPNYIEMRFVPPKTDEQKQTTPFRTNWTQLPYTWPGYFSAPVFDIDEQNPRGGEDATGQIFLPRGIVRFPEPPQPPQSGMWDAIIEEWYSPTGWTRDQRGGPKPMGDHTDIEFYGVGQSFSDYLHPEFIIPRQDRPALRKGSGSTVSQAIIPAIKVPATNFQRPAPFVLSDEVKFIDSEGCYLRTRQRIFPAPKRRAQQLA